MEIRVSIFWTAKKRQCYTNKQAALDRKYATADRPKYNLLNEPLSVAPPTSIHAECAYKVLLVLEAKSGQWRPLLDKSEKNCIKYCGYCYEYNII